MTSLLSRNLFAPAPFVGPRPSTTRKAHINLGQQFGALPPGFIVSPITGMFIPIFPVDITHEGYTERLNVGFDTGMTGAHLEIPTSLAKKLGLVERSKEEWRDASGAYAASSAFIDQISLPGWAGCVVESATVTFHDDAPILIGNDFIRDIGASITYGENGPTLTCSGNRPEPGIYLPVFGISIIHQGRALNVEALFDTGWEGVDLALPSSMAELLQLPIVGQTTGITHSGTVTLSKAKADRVSVQQVGQCYVQDALVNVYQKGSVLDKINKVIVGERFFKQTGGMIGYDQDGAFFRCQSTSKTVRATKIERVPLENIPVKDISFGGIPTWIWIAGGLAVVAGGTYFLTRP